MEIFEPKYDVGTDSWVLELKQKAPYFCYTTPSTSNSSIGSSCSTTPPHPDWRNGVEMSRDSADGGAHPSFLKRRWRSIKGAVSRFWTCCSNPPMPLEEAHVASRDSASDAMQWPRPRHGVYYSEMPEEEREKKRKEVIAFCNYQWQRPETEELHHKEIIAEENAVEIEMEEDEISPPPPSKLKAELMQEHKNMKNNNKNENENENANANANLDDSIVPTDIVYSFTGLCEPSDTNKIIIKKHEKRVHHRHHLEECTIEDQKLEKKLELIGLKVNQIKLDRHSLFRAVEDQLSLYSGRASRCHHRELREMAATSMREHKSDFLPFFQSSSRRFEEYCRQVESGDAWGGRLELGALSHCLRRHIVLFSGNFHDLEIGKAYYRSEGGSGSLDPSIMLSYHMHPFGLREHYNSVVPDV